MVKSHTPSACTTWPFSPEREELNTSSSPVLGYSSTSVLGGDIADVAQQQDGLSVLAVIKLFAALERVFGIVCQADLIDKKGGLRVLREDAVQIAPAARRCDPAVCRDVRNELPRLFR